MANTAAAKMLDFIAANPTRFHIIAGFEKRLGENGYTKLYQKDAWQLVPGGKYFVSPNGSSIIAFRIPKELKHGFMISAAHSDSPSFKIKENCDKISANYTQLNTEVYGGALLATWFDKPLSVAGRVLVKENGTLATRLCNIDRDLMVVPSVAIHMNRTANKGFEIKPNVDTLPLLGDENAKDMLMQLVAESVGAAKEDIMGHDLFVYSRQKPTFIGAKSEYMCAPQIDDIECAFGLMEGFVAARESQSVPVCCVFDNEEVGSETKQGAAASVLADTLKRIVRGMGKTEDDYMRMLDESFMVSADNAHAMHPNHPEYSDSCNCPFMNKGIVIKFNANQKYTTDAVSAAVFRKLCQEEGVPTQVYANRSDLGGGGTLGSIATTKLPVNTVDIGLAQLAMHSSYETAGCEDIASLVNAMTAFYSRSFTADKGSFNI